MLLQAIVGAAHYAREVANGICNAISPFSDLTVDALAFYGLISLLRKGRDRQRDT